MVYDEKTADRFRRALARLEVTEKRMMGGVVFMLNGNMLGGAHREKTGERLFMFRVGKDNEAEALARPHARRMQLGARTSFSGFVFVDADSTDEKALRSWIDLALSYVEGMPAK